MGKTYGNFIKIIIEVITLMIDSKRVAFEDYLKGAQLLSVIKPVPCYKYITQMQAHFLLEYHLLGCKVDNKSSRLISHQELWKSQNSFTIMNGVMLARDWEGIYILAGYSAHGEDLAPIVEALKEIKI